MNHQLVSARLMKYALVGLAAAGGVAAWSFAYQVFVPVGGKDQSVVIRIPRGTSAYRVAMMLKEAGLVRHPRFLHLLVGLMGSTRHLKAGEYELSPTMNLWTIVRFLREGKVKTYPFLVREGATIRQIAADLERQGFGSAATFELYTRRPYLCREYGVPAPLESLEGYLFPDTYYLSKGMSEFEILRMMLNNFSAKFTPAMAQQAEALRMTRHEVVTLASIIEWEAEVDKERAMISGVFHNRLRRGQNLQSCATVLYAIGKRKRLFEKDLVVESIYNTYKYPGLPPTPINNPGLASIRAALEPADVPYFYFVSKGDHTHFFSVTGREHAAAVQKARRMRAERLKAIRKAKLAKSEG